MKKDGKDYIILLYKLKKNLNFYNNRSILNILKFHILNNLLIIQFQPFQIQLIKTLYKNYQIKMKLFC